MAKTSEDLKTARAGFSQEVRDRHMVPLWEFLGSVFTPEPATRVQPFLWPWSEVRPRLLRAAELLTAKEAERRVLVLANPGLGLERPSATHTMHANFQIICRGEVAPAHRHSASAMRFIVDGSGAYTSVDGERTYMQPGDFVLTQNWTWHDHGSDSDQPVIWLDGLDIPLTVGLNQIFYESFAEDRFPVTRPADASYFEYGSGLRPRYKEHTKPYSPVVNYRWERTHEALKTLGQEKEAGSPYDDIILEYTNPLTGGPALPTISAFIQLIRPGRELKPHRHTSSTVYVVARGHGVTEIDGREFAWQQNDAFVVPPWAKHRHVNTSASEDAILFSESDEAVVRALGLYRELGD